MIEDSPEMQAYKRAAEEAQAQSDLDDDPDAIPWQVTGQASFNRSLMAERDADSGYIAEITLSSIGGVALLSLDEPSADEVQLLRELLVSNELIALVRTFLREHPRMAYRYGELMRMRDMLELLDEVWP